MDRYYYSDHRRSSCSYGDLSPPVPMAFLPRYLARLVVIRPPPRDHDPPSHIPGGPYAAHFAQIRRLSTLTHSPVTSAEPQVRIISLIVIRTDLTWVNPRGLNTERAGIKASYCRKGPAVVSLSIEKAHKFHTQLMPVYTRPKLKSTNTP